jgi:hypothetical protein
METNSLKMRKIINNCKKEGKMVMKSRSDGMFSKFSKSRFFSTFVLFVAAFVEVRPRPSAKTCAHAWARQRASVQPPQHAGARTHTPRALRTRACAACSSSW